MRRFFMFFMLFVAVAFVGILLYYKYLKPAMVW